VEWPDDKLRDKKKDKIPGLFFYRDRSIIGMAGFWECVADDEGKDFFSSCLITLDPNAMLKSLPHHRMPAMLRGAALEKWLNSSMVDADQAAALCRTTPDEEMDGYFISKAVNVGENNSSKVLTQIGTFDEENDVVSARNKALGY
jgi:putative SOS response-associated peptidase YedK